MKNIKLSIIALFAIGNLGYAGGDISPITVYETDDVVMATEAYEEAVIVPVVEEPVYITPVPIVTEKTPMVVTPVPEPIVTPVPIKTETSGSNGFYAGLGITGVKYQSACDCDVGGGSEDNMAAVGRIGYDFNKYIGIEARGMTTVSGDGGADVEHMGLFIKPMVHVSSAANIYALIGAAKTKTSGDLQNVDAESLALGAGVEYDLSTDLGQGDEERGLGLFIDYERLVAKKDAPDLDTISAGVTYDF